MKFWREGCTSGLRDWTGGSRAAACLATIYSFAELCEPTLSCYNHNHVNKELGNLRSLFFIYRISELAPFIEAVELELAALALVATLEELGLAPFVLEGLVSTDGVGFLSLFYGFGLMT